MILDCFLFYNELDFVEGRFEYLYDKVDFFVVIESNVTFTGKPKPYYFRDNLHKYKKYLDKIFYHPIHFDKVSADPWDMEKAQRQHIADALKFFNDDDYVIISDVDEIPSKSGIDLAIKKINDGFPVAKFAQIFFYYNFNQCFKNFWVHPTFTKVSTALNNKIDYLRHYHINDCYVPNGGYHMSFWGADPEKIKTKLESYSHQEYNTPKYTDINYIIDRIKNGDDLFMREELLKVDKSKLDKELFYIFNKYTRDI